MAREKTEVNHKQLLIISTTNSAANASGRQMSFGGFTVDALKANMKEFAGLKDAFKPINVDALNMYNSMLEQEGNDSAKALEAVTKQYGKLSDATMTYIDNAHGGRVATDKLSKSFASLGLKGFAAQAGMMALNAALNVGVSLAVSAVISGITYLVTAQERAIEKSEELQSQWKEAENTLAENKNTIAEISGEYETLSQGVDSLGRNVSLTADEYSRYNEIANKIAAMFPEMVQGYTAEGNAIIKAKGSVEALTEAYEKMAEAQRGAVISGANDVIKGIQAQTVDNNIGEKSLLNQYKALEEYLNLLAEGEQELANQIFDPSSKLKERRQKASALDEALREIGVREGNLNENAYANQKELNTYLRGLKTQLGSAGMGYYPIIDALLGGDEGYKALSSETQSLVDSVVRSIDPASFLQYDSYGKLNSFIVDSVLGPLKNGKTSQEISEALSLKDAFANNSVSLGKYKQSIEEVKNVTKDMTPEVQDSIMSMFDLSDVDPLVNKLKGKVQEEDWGKLYNLKLDDLKLAAGIEIETNISYADLRKKLDEAKAAAVKSASEINTSFQNTQASQKAVNEAYKEIEALGAISQETYSKLVEANSDFAQALDDSTGYLTMNYDAMQNIINAEYEQQKVLTEQAKAQKLIDYRENAKRLKDLEEELKDANEEEETRNKLLEEQKKILLSQDGILSEIRNLEILGSSLEYATSAYKKWLDAKDAPENSDIFDSLAEAAKDIKEGFETGKIGTRKFASAAELIYGENWVNMSRDQMQKDLKEIEKYFTGDVEGMAIGVEKLYKDGILGKEGDNYFSVAGKTLEDYAESLGLSAEATRYFLGALKDYGWEIDIPGMGEYTELVQDYELSMKALEEQQAKVNKLVSEYDPETATIEETKTLIEEQQKLLDLQKQAAEAESKVSLEEPELTELDLLKQELKEVQTAYDSLKELTVKGNVDEKFLEELKTAGDYIDKIVGISDVSKALGEVESQIAGLQELMAKGIMPEGLGKALIANLQETWTALRGRLQELIKENKFETAPEVERVAIDVPSSDEERAQKNAEKRKAEEKRLARLAGERKRLEKNPEWVQLQENLAYYEKTLASYSPEQTYEKDVLQSLIERTKEKIKEIEKQLGINLELDVDKDQALNDVKEAIPETQTINTEVVVDDSAAESEIDKLKQEAEEGATLPVKIETQGGGKNIFKNIFGFAKGTRNAPGGPALVGEGVKNGKFQPEIVVKKKTGEYFVTDQPQLVDLDRGDVVLNGDETKKILKGNKPKSGFAFEGGFNLKELVKTVTTGVANLVSGVGAGIKGVLSSGNGVAASGKLPTTNKSSNSGGAKKIDPADLVDWIPKLLERLSKYTEKLVKEAEKAIGYMAQNMGLDKALANTKLEMEKNEAAYARYMKQAEAVGLSRELAQKVQMGEIEIEAYDEKTRELITNYQKWYDLANGCLDTVEELKEQQIELSKQKLDNINTYYENRLERLESQAQAGQEGIDLKAASGKEITASDYTRILSATEKQLNLLYTQREALSKEFESLVSQGIIRQDTEAWREYTGQIEELGSQITQTQIDLIGFKDAVKDLPLTNLDYALNALRDMQSTMEATMSLHEAQSAEHAPSDYEKLIRNSMEQMNNLEKQNVYLREQQMGLDVLSEKYQEIQGEINANEDEILQAKIAQEEWNDAILDLKISKLEEEREELEKTNDAYQKQLDLQKAMDDLEKAKSQKTKLIYRENQGFKYEVDQEALQNAQERVNEIRHQETLDKIDEAIEALENQKKDDNVYDYNGQLIKPYAKGGVDRAGGLGLLHGTPNHVETIFNAEDGKKLYDLIHGTDNLTHELVKTFDASSLMRQINSASRTVMPSITMGDIVIEKADNVEGLANDIVKYFPNAMLKEIYRN